MNAYVIPSIEEKIISFPISLAETELRRGKSIHVGTFTLEPGQQRLQLRSLVLHLVRVLNPGSLPILANPMGALSVGLYQASMLTGALALVARDSVGVSAYNAYKSCDLYAPDNYRIIVSNNTKNLDYSVTVTGAIKLYL